MDYVIELLKSEQRKLKKLIITHKQLIGEGYSYKFFTDIEKYVKQLEDVNKAIDKLGINESMEFKPWEVVRFTWGTAVRHTKGKWEKLFLNPDAQEIDVRKLAVVLHDDGIEILGVSE